ncbi:replication factor C subunit, variant [Capsaspora owczarzaki ATCC 30864]|uniref:Replication factor C subunit, variant n=1 Tax=Capsaspora owczarzaki (strain ATCC 30864) TaxID=595528 RepID=A0A0D2X077_CAPO3|nr:replication factor C subunit, variant [Capsaspora owczarzaki ATCC 30864]
MALWVDKYRPTNLDKLDYNLTLSKQLKHLVSAGDFPHMMVYGPPGAGKKTRVMCLLRELYGPGVEKLKVEHRTFKTPSDAKLEIITIASNYHIELNPSDAGTQDRLVVQDILKEIASSHQLDTQTQRSFKVVVLTEVDKLSKDAQHALRRTMELYVSTCRLILLCNSTSKVLSPIRSRCLGIRIPAPTVPEIVTVLQSIARKEGISVSGDFATRIAESSDRNLRKAILSFEACRVQQYPFVSNQPIQKADWEVYVEQTASEILGEQSPKW